MRYNSLENSSELINGVVIRMLTQLREEGALLTEVLRSDWSDMFNTTSLAFGRCYYSITQPGIARDEHEWHLHKRQKVRFVVLEGVAVIALYDPRPQSSTRGLLNIFRLPGAIAPELQCVVLVPEGVLHSVLAIGTSPCILLGFPTQLYDPSDETKVPFSDARVSLADGTFFSWQKVRDFESEWFAHW